jgi:hypothetical protein
LQQAQPIAPWGEVEEGVRSGLGKAENSGTSSTAETSAALSPDCLGYDDRAAIVPCGPFGWKPRSIHLGRGFFQAWRLFASRSTAWFNISA